MLGQGVGLNSLEDMQNLAFSSATGNRVVMLREAKRAIQGNIYGVGSHSVVSGNQRTSNGYGRKKKESSSVTQSGKFIGGAAARSAMYPAGLLDDGLSYDAATIAGYTDYDMKQGLIMSQPSQHLRT